MFLLIASDRTPIVEPKTIKSTLLCMCQLLRRRQELDYHWKKNAPRLRRRNLLTGLAIGAFVVGIYTIVSVKQERIVEELDDEARIHISRGPRTSANS
uniref:Cytochrome c oxidase assembly factor 3 n=1 Tax=Scophthalmus maximus TaxID=52904 RepID=A0A8D3DLF6_SCOMX